MEKKNVNFEDVVYFQEGPGVRNWQFRDSGIKLINIRNLVDSELCLENTTNYLEVEEVENKYQHFLLNAGDFVMASSGVTWGKIAEVHEEHLPLCLNTSIIRLVSKDTDVLDKWYLYYYIKSPQFRRQIERLITGSAQPNFGPSHLKKVVINLPEICNQREAVEQFTKVEAVINKRQKEIELLDDLIKARFVEMFGDPKTNPKGYTKITVEEAIEAGYIEKPFDGNHGSKHPKASEYVEEGIPFLMANNVIGGTVDQVNCSFITEERANKLDKGFAKDSDVLITHKGTIGRTAVLRTDYEFVMLTPQVAAYRVKRGITSDYLCGYFGTDFFQNDMKVLAAAGGSTRAYAGITAQLQLHLIIPPLDEQKVYTNFIHQVDKSKVAVQKALDETQKLFDSLMQEYFG